MRCNEMVGISPLNLNEYFTQAIIPIKASGLHVLVWPHGPCDFCTEYLKIKDKFKKKRLLIHDTYKGNVILQLYMYRDPL